MLHFKFQGPYNIPKFTLCQSITNEDVNHIYVTLRSNGE